MVLLVLLADRSRNVCTRQFVLIQESETRKRMKPASSDKVGTSKKKSRVRQNGRSKLKANIKKLNMDERTKRAQIATNKSKKIAKERIRRKGERKA